MEIFIFNLKEINGFKFQMERIPSNFLEINKSKIFKNLSQASINDILIHNDEIFFII